MKLLPPNLIRHLPMKYFGALNTTILVFIEYQQRKQKNSLF